jgi:hypothetical protein
VKLRIRGDSIRLRLSRSEILEIAQGRPVRDSVRFGAGASLSYSLIPAQEPGISARFEGSEVRVSIEERLARSWASSEQVSLEAEQPLDADPMLSILVEKDFFCLNPRSRPEDESDLFPNPGHSHGHCG